MHRRRRPRRRARRARCSATPTTAGCCRASLSSWIFVALLQAAIGYIQYFNDVPALLVGLHVAGATALWAMTVWLVLSTSAAPSRGRPWPAARTAAGTFAPMTATGRRPPEHADARDEVRYEVADHVATITLDAPERMNTISGPMLGGDLPATCSRPTATRTCAASC